jgi:hypothetical protein
MNCDPRLYLSARRPCGKDDADPPIAEALEKASADPKLTEWVHEQKCTDTEICKKLREVQPPPALRERILAGAQVARSPWKTWFGRFVSSRFGVGPFVAIAATILILVAALSVHFGRDVNASEGWQTVAAREVAVIEQNGSTDPLDHVVSDMPAIREWLTAQTCPAPASLPSPVQRLAIYGCAKRSWQGHPLSIVCFAFDGGREVHLVTIDRKHLPSPPPEGAPSFATVQGYQTASWSEGSVAMMLIGKVQRTELEKLFRTTPAAQISTSSRLLASLAE